MDAYREFYLGNRQKLFSYLMRLTGDYQLSNDIMQESFTRVLSQYNSQDRSVALLFKIARNAAFDLARKNRHDEAPENWDPPDTVDSEKMILVREDYRNVLSAIQQLEKCDRDLLALVASSSLSYKEIAGITGISDANVRVRIHRARIRLRQILDRGD